MLYEYIKVLKLRLMSIRKIHCSIGNLDLPKTIILSNSPKLLMVQLLIYIKVIFQFLYEK
ncbi:hypothetical protein NSTC745_05493 [Nostoc sp. DSM 114161]|jgi:hypothetical protein